MERKRVIYHNGAGAIAWILRSVLHYRTEEVMINLSRSFPDKKYKELKDIHKKFYRHLGEVITEALWFGKCLGKRGCKRLHRSHIVEITNPEVLNRMFDGSLQVMALESHTGNWELVGGFFNYNYTDTPLSMGPEHIAVTYNRLHSARWDRFMAKNRCAPLKGTDFDGYCESREILRYAVSHRRDKRVYVFITDQFPYKFATKHHLGKFMNQDTETMNGAAVLACKMNMAVVYLRFACREGGGYSLTLIPITEHAGECTPEAIMEQYYKLLEEDINAQPWNYLWSHKRWK
ncbi:MAG: lysophospholipid acyltransferase family protein [Bacteroidales bacterium]|nr:lysophospholipid acyltransferase family protein [Bacteroidales bacterium]